MLSRLATSAVVALLALGATATLPASRGTSITVGTTLPPPAVLQYRVPVADVSRASWGTTHASYPATDIFVACGAAIVAPTNGKVLEVRRTDNWSAAVDNPATRGGRSVAMLGDDGVRYYFAHFQSIDAKITVGSKVTIGQMLGAMGSSGRTSACHLHFGISPPCPALEYIVRRGVVWPYKYLDAWRRGEALSPQVEVSAWTAKHPTACADAAADPYAGSSL